jgi:hypothetical protein
MDLSPKHQNHLEVTLTEPPHHPKRMSNIQTPASLQKMADDIKPLTGESFPKLNYSREVVG